MKVTLRTLHPFMSKSSKKTWGIKELYKQQNKDYASKDFNIDTYDNLLDREFFETAGDLEDMYKILMYDISNLPSHYTEQEKFNRLAKLAQLAYGQMTHREFTELNCYIVFKERYPSLAQTILIWGWS